MSPSHHIQPAAADTSRRAVTESAGLHPSQRPAVAESDDTFGNLVRRASSGDREAMERLLFDAQAVAWRFSRAVCGHAEDAEDAMQEALVQTFRFVSRVRDPGAFRTWLYRTVRNACLMSRRRKVDEPARMLSLDALLPAPDAHERIDPPAAGKNPAQLAENSALRRQLARAMAKLPPAFRIVLFLREMEGLSTREAAEVLRVTEDTVKARLHRARLFLQRELAAADAPRTPRARKTRPRARAREDHR